MEGLIQCAMLQMGTDLQRLNDGLKFLRKTASDHRQGKGHSELQLSGSIFLPSKR